MCKYALFPYKPHYACFNCRKTFKRKLLIDIDRDAAYNNERKEIEAVCPECGNLMADMGKDFESPKKNDLKKWGHMRDLFEAGVTFHSCGCTGPGYIPKNKEKLLEFLEQRKNLYIKHRKFWTHREEPKTDSEKSKDWKENSAFLISIPYNLKIGTRKRPKVDIEKAVSYWNNKIIEVETKIKKITTANSTYM